MLTLLPLPAVLLFLSSVSPIRLTVAGDAGRLLGQAGDVMRLVIVVNE